ncbi:hypothetical protein Tco_0821352 [Tanacetum coccineum]|uniref:Uncharacterized protein n=1 Tax=Tanacetum coccineum TaxID=301880 RepID=A0ABQ5AGC5_9ASTR
MRGYELHLNGYREIDSKEVVYVFFPLWHSVEECLDMSTEIEGCPNLECQGVVLVKLALRGFAGVKVVGVVVVAGKMI